MWKGNLWEQNCGHIRAKDRNLVEGPLMLCEYYVGPDRLTEAFVCMYSQVDNRLLGNLPILKTFSRQPCSYLPPCRSAIKFHVITVNCKDNPPEMGDP